MRFSGAFSSNVTAAVTDSRYHRLKKQSESAEGNDYAGKTAEDDYDTACGGVFGQYGVAGST